jgi:hypothetical protein
MRAGPLSNPKVIELLNRYFVPVTSPNEEAGDVGRIPEERSERKRIYLEFLNRKLPVGEVHVYLMDPDAHAIEGVDISHAAQSDYLIAALERTAAKLKTAAGPPVIQPAPRSVPPPHEADSMVFHLVARGSHEGDWRQFPAENWIVLSAAEWTALLPPAGAGTGTVWNIDPKLASRLLMNFYPQTEETTSADRNRIDRLSLEMKILSVHNGEARVRIDGAIRMKHSFAPHRPDDNYVEAKVVGFMDFSPTARRIDVFRLVTTEATYGNEAERESFGAALRSIK